MLKSLLLLFITTTRGLILPDVHVINNLPSIREVVHTIPQEIKFKIVEDTTGLLPKLDWFSHLMLTNNERLIDSLLHADIDEDFKKKVILKIIDVLREGDEMGGVILTKYYNLIDILL